jgi:hypothetical protein
MKEPSRSLLDVVCGCLPAGARKSLFICVLYGAISMSLALVNKALLSSYKFECYFLLLSVQMCVHRGRRRAANGGLHFIVSPGVVAATTAAALQSES